MIIILTSTGVIVPGGRKVNTLGPEQFNTFLVSLLIKEFNWTIDHHSCKRNINSRLDIRESFVALRN